MLALKAVLQRSRLKQSALALHCGVSQATIAQILNHDKWPVFPGRMALQKSMGAFLEENGFASQEGFFERVPTAGAAGAQVVCPKEDVEMLLRKKALTHEARRHFGLACSPFDGDVQESGDVYSTPQLRYVREYLWQTAKSGGFVALVGESGAGKSILRKDLEDRIIREQAPIVLIQPYVLGMEDSDAKGKTLKAASIADAMIVTVAPHERPKLTMEAKSRQLHRILRDSRRAGYAHCLVIEEAHALNTQTLKHLKRFLELQDGFRDLLSVILIGQPELRMRLSERAPEVREVVQRCEIVELLPLDSKLDDYVAFKFARVGSDLLSVCEPDALDGMRERLVFCKSGQDRRNTISLLYPLMVNNLLASAMNEAARLGFSKVNADLIRES